MPSAFATETTSGAGAASPVSAHGDGGMNILLYALLKAVIVVAFLGLNAFVLIWAERKISGYIQRRYGPLRVGGPAGALQSAADILKLLTKEDFVPGGAGKGVTGRAGAPRR